MAHAEKPGRLLVLDDDSDVAETLCMMAATVGYETDHTDDPDVFLERIGSWLPTHVAVDLKLSHRDGVEVLRSLAQMDCEASVIIMSGLGERILNSSARAATESGLFITGILPKPIFRAKLIATLAIGNGNSVPRHKNIAVSRQLTVNREQLADAIQAREFIAHFQPKVSCSTGELVGFECLARWPQANGSMIPPDLFIGLAERTGLINALSRQIYDYVFANLPESAGEPGLKYALNLSSINLGDPEFSPWLLEKCQEYRVAPSRIVLELTETASMDNAVSGLEKLTQFRIQGFQLSIDDFGVGYSSMVQLARLPFSELKIDQMFVKTLATSAESQKIATAIVALGHSLGLSVVAEGVEDAQALGILRDLGCDEAQGYFIARPMDSQAAKVWRAIRQ